MCVRYIQRKRERDSERKRRSRGGGRRKRFVECSSFLMLRPDIAQAHAVRTNVPACT